MLILLKEMIALYFENRVIHFGLDIFCGQKAFVDSFFPHRSTAPSGPRPPLVLASISHSDTPRLVGLLWTSDQLVAETST